MHHQYDSELTGSRFANGLSPNCYGGRLGNGCLLGVVYFARPLTAAQRNRGHRIRAGHDSPPEQVFHFQAEHEPRAVLPLQIRTLRSVDQVEGRLSVHVLVHHVTFPGFTYCGRE